MALNTPRDCVYRNVLLSAVIELTTEAVLQHFDQNRPRNHCCHVNEYIICTFQLTEDRVGARNRNERAAGGGVVLIASVSHKIESKDHYAIEKFQMTRRFIP